MKKKSIHYKYIFFFGFKMDNKMIIASKTDNLQKVEKFIDNFSAEHDIDEELYGNLLIAALEATNNAITHGNKLDERKNVELSLVKEDEKILLAVKDEGNGFDYQNLPDPTSPENIENMSGRGVFLMSRLSDKIVFENNGSFVKMIFFI